MIDKDRLEEVNQIVFTYAHKLREIGMEGNIVFLLHTIELLQKENENLKDEIEDMNLQAKADGEKDY
jgi:hypothetical protein